MKASTLSLLTAVALLPLLRSSAETPPPGANIALVAAPSASYTSGDTSTAALNDGNQPANSRQRGTGSYGNWNRTGTQWVQYDWPKPISTRQIEVYWWDDHQGVRLPAACRLLYWDGEAFQSVSNAVGLGVAADQFNVTTFDEVTAPRLRLEIDGNGEYSTGILEWRVLDSGKSPRFPAVIDAGIDRIVALDASTYLTGSVKDLYAADGRAAVRWSKRSGPGEVIFEEAERIVTKARFSEPGEYELEVRTGEGDWSATDPVRVTVQPVPALPPLRPVPSMAFAVTSPFWWPRLKAQVVNWIPHCIARIADPDLREGGINNFVAAAAKLRGEDAGRHRGYPFSNAWVYNTIESICLALELDPRGDEEMIAAQAAMKTALEEWIPVIVAAQEPDGYLQTAFTLDDSRSRWTPRHRGDHEGYVAGYLLEAAIAHHRLTRGQDSRLYDAAKRLADCWDTNIGPAPKRAWYNGHQAMELALVRFGRYVDEVEGGQDGRRYVALAKFLLDCRDGGSEYDQSHVPVIQQYEAVGHAVRAVYSYAGMADVVLETGDADYYSAVMSIWDNLVNRKYYVTGGIGSGETSEGFGPDYSLPNRAYCESCSSCGQIFFQHRLNRLHRDGRYAALLEETLYNALLGSMDLEGRNFYYQNPLDGGGPRYDWHGCPCCVGNIPRTLLSLPTWMYATDEKGLYVNLYLGSRVRVDGVAGGAVDVVQATEYPWQGQVTLTINPAEPGAFAVRLLVPDRDVSALYDGTPSADGLEAVAVNGEAVNPPIVNGYAVIEREWKAGDQITLEIPMRVQRVKGIDRIAATAGKVALRYGPLVYNVERMDQDITQVLEPAAPLSPAWNADLLGGVMTITGQWADGSAFLAIPNYARANRDNPEGPGGRGRAPGSIVWIRDQ